MKQGRSNLRQHRHPGSLQAIEEPLCQVKHGEQVDGEEVGKDVGVCMLNDILLLAHRAQYWLGEEQDQHQRQEDDGIDHPRPIQVHSAED